ncbi:MAG: hypothetical protein ISS88_02275 [Candidatus Portnoybacteria bacterium]|nr:hypothetical protein [Candidatus Portnoybacteria bacterium]
MRKLKKEVWGVDVDGVMAGFPYYDFCKRIKLDYFVVYCFYRLPLMNHLFYWLLRVNQRMVELLRRIDECGHKIVIITGHNLKNEKLLRTFLGRNKVPFHELYLIDLVCPDDQYYFRFKLDAIRKSGCNVYIDDREDVVRFLEEHLNGNCRIIHYRYGEDHRLLERLLFFP